MPRALPLTTALYLAATTPLWANSWSLAPDGTQFRKIESRDTFVDLVSKYSLSRFGITLKVLPNGLIDGRAFGQKVTGEWQWRDGFFCRDMAWGSMDIGSNCQEVKFGGGNLLRFTSDEGTGDWADLRLR